MTDATVERHEATIAEMSARNALPMGGSYFVGAESGLVTHILIWALGGVAAVEHFHRGDDRHPVEMMRAARRPDTLWTPRRTITLCPDCHGNGVLKRRMWGERGPVTVGVETCRRCDGRGEIA